MKKPTFFIFFLLGLILSGANAQNVQERQLYFSNFQDWTKSNASATESVIEKQTAFSNETLQFKLKNILVDPAGTDAKFISPEITAGYMRCEKTADTYIEVGPLKSVTRVAYVHCATGGSRGFKLEKKGKDDADWVVLSDAVANPAGGVLVDVSLTSNTEDVVLRFTNLTTNQYAFITELSIYGNVEITGNQVTLVTDVYPASAGSVSHTPSGTQFDEGTDVTFTATPSFGYKFNRWVDESSNVLSNANPATIAINNDITVIAEFATVNTYKLEVEVSEGAQLHQVAISPAGTVVSGATMYEDGSSVTLTAGGNKIFTFNYWDDNSTNPVRTVVMNSDKKLKANYSNADYIVGWDMIKDEPKSDRGADFYSDASNMGMLVLRNAEGTSVGWLAKGSAQYEGRPAIVSWREFSEKCYYEISFSTVGYSNIKLSSAMLSHYNGYKVQNIEYSLDGETFQTLGTIVFNSQKTWFDSEITLPADAENKTKVYVRWIPDYSSETLLNSPGSTKDGTAITDIYLLADIEVVEDHDAPVLVSSVPANNATDVSAVGSVVLVFNEKVSKGSGDVTLGGEVLNGIFNGNTVVYKYSALEYNKKYTLSVPAGAIVDLSGNECAAISRSFTTMNRVAPAARLFDFIVGPDAGDDGTTIASAINAAPVNGSKFMIFVKNGQYNERISIPSSKPNISLIGQSRDGVIINAAAHVGDAIGSTTSNSQTVEVMADNFYAENLTFQNSAGMNIGQAVALKDYGNKNIYYNVKLLGYQDTHLTGNGRQFYQKCAIHGTVDFIFGGGDVFFDECLLYLEDRNNNVIVAPSTKAGTQWGYVFNNCTIDGAAINNNGFNLGRPWQNKPRAVYLNTKMNILPTAAGWTSMSVLPALFAEFNSVNKNGQPIDLSNRSKTFTVGGSLVVGAYNPVLTTLEAAQYTIKNVLGGTDNWMPGTFTERVANPVAKADKAILSWSAVEYAICYIVSRDGKVVGFTTSTSYDMAGMNGEYSVQAANEYGGLSESSNKVAYVATSVGAVDNDSNIVVYASNGNIVVKGISDRTAITVYDVNGRIIKEFISVDDCSFVMNKGIWIVKVESGSQVTTKKVPII